jgi:AcrR family transcriptional regulator
MEQKKKRDESIQRILEAAMSVFAEEGFSGARMDEIARRAGLNKAMIYYRVGDKKTLYREVIQTLFGDIGNAITVKIPEGSAPEEKFRYYINGLTQTIAEHPYLPGIMLREMASGGQNLDEYMANDFAKILGVPEKIISEGIEKGVFIKTSPLIVHMMIVGFMMFFRATEPARKRYEAALPDSAGVLGSKSIVEGMKEIELLVLRAIKA